MIYTGYKSINGTVGIIGSKYPKFMQGCYNDLEVTVGYTYLDLLKTINEKLFYTMDYANLFHYENVMWIPLNRDNELNKLLNYIEKNPEILLMAEL